jgi:imidazolonepropionase-like amidohydrolase
MLKKAIVLLMLLSSVPILGQDYFPNNSGVATKNSNYTLFKNATIYKSPSEVIKKGSLLIKEARIIAIGKNIKTPANSTVIDLKGKFIYPSFIDIYTDFGVSKPERVRGSGPQYDASRSGFYWNDHIRPEQEAIHLFKYDQKKAENLQSVGFGSVNTSIQDGIVRGTGALIALNDKGDNSVRVLNPASAQFLSFSKSVQSRQSYPTSLMGSMALLRQMYMDAKWYENGNSSTTDLALEALNRNQSLPQIFEAGSRSNIVRADKVGDQFNIQYIIVGGGDEYERVEDVKKTNATLILPIDFQKAYDVEDPFLASTLSISDLRTWNQGPFNPSILESNDIPFALTTHGLKSAKDFKTNLLEAISKGLSKETALSALTTVPASLLGMSDQLGTLKEGAIANFIITSGDVFEKDTKLYENWVQGEAHIINTINQYDIRGEYSFKIGDEEIEMSITGSLEKQKVNLTSDQKKLGAKMNFQDDWMTLTYTSSDQSPKAFTRISAYTTDGNTLSGSATLPNDDVVPFKAAKTDSEKEEKKTEKERDQQSSSMYAVTYPNVAYGFNQKPQPETLLFKNATVWTNEQEGIVENIDLLIKDGKISKIGKNLNAGGATVIDATGKHITPGIIDEHSHIAAASINEAGHNSSAEVTIEDVIRPMRTSIFTEISPEE